VSPGRHQLCLYEGVEDLAARIVPWMEEGVDEGEAVIAAWEPEKRDLMLDALGPASERMTFLDLDLVYQRPEITLAGYDKMTRDLLRGGARAVRLTGELPICTTQDEQDVWTHYEALLNRALAHLPLWIVCSYDRNTVSDTAIDVALQTHTHCLDDGAWEPSLRYADPEEIVRRHTPAAQQLPELRELVGRDGLRDLRVELTTEMARARISGDRASGMLVAADELLANARRHGGGAPIVRAGVVGDSFVCEVADQGPGFDDPLAGYIPPSPGDDHGAGLWVTRQVTSRLELLPSDRGLTARAWV
jgi:anti-sigma regulatory factor (Ser/Thr protein kinase)